MNQFESSPIPICFYVHPPGSSAWSGGTYLLVSSHIAAMSRQAQAERERLARITLATAELQAAEKRIEAAKMYESSAEGLSLRWMNILYEIGQQPGTNTIIMVPSNMPQAGMPSIGVYGVKGLTELQSKEKLKEKDVQTDLE
jgi:hypothetical protein